ncbi:MAG: ferrochelatase [Pseudomonadales bacterium]|jgi:ferrochelatase|nr:ferrochelatase [Pseudomonadales bacterium]
MSQRAVLLVNLGSPDRPDIPSVRHYLDEFLMDRHVIQLPWLLRRLLVSLFILPKRPDRVAYAYGNIWTPRGSPLVALSQDLLKEVQARIPLPVAVAMRYGRPLLEGGVLKLAALPGITEILLLPLYPHYAESTVLTCVNEAERVIKKHHLNVTLTVPPPFYAHPSYINALVESAKPWLEQSFDHVVFSYHGLPEQHLRSADPTHKHCLKTKNCCQVDSPAHATCYRHQIMRTTAAFVAASGLRQEQYSISFQSRLGRAKWLEPTTEHTLKILAAKGVKKVLVLCPSFVTDCLETLEEIELQGLETFKHAGGTSLTLIPCLNTHPAWVETVCRLVQE